MDIQTWALIIVSTILIAVLEGTYRIVTTLRSEILLLKQAPPKQGRVRIQVEETEGK